MLTKVESGRIVVTDCSSGPESDLSYDVSRLRLLAMVQKQPVRVGRRLSAILAADVAGYSRLMHDDEEATHARLTALLADVIEPAIAEHGGRIVKNTGDGFLAEFPSAVEAVRAATHFQNSVRELAIGDPEDRRLVFRVGINIGDVIVEAHDIFGDGVNIAARLEALAYNLGNFLRTLAAPKPIKDWSLTSLKEKLIKIGAKVVSHGRYIAFQMAEVAIPRQMFQEILRLIAELRPQPPPAPA